MNSRALFIVLFFSFANEATYAQPKYEQNWQNSFDSLVVIGDFSNLIVPFYSGKDSGGKSVMILYSPVIDSSEKYKYCYARSIYFANLSEENAHYLNVNYPCDSARIYKNFADSIKINASDRMLRRIKNITYEVIESYNNAFDYGMARNCRLDSITSIIIPDNPKSNCPVFAGTEFTKISSTNVTMKYSFLKCSRIISDNKKFESGVFTGLESSYSDLLKILEQQLLLNNRRISLNDITLTIRGLADSEDVSEQGISFVDFNGANREVSYSQLKKLSKKGGTYVKYLPSEKFEEVLNPSIPKIIKSNADLALARCYSAISIFRKLTNKPIDIELVLADKEGGDYRGVELVIDFPLYKLDDQNGFLESMRNIQ